MFRRKPKTAITFASAVLWNTAHSSALSPADDKLSIEFNIPPDMKRDKVAPKIAASLKDLGGGGYPVSEGVTWHEKDDGDQTRVVTPIARGVTWHEGIGRNTCIINMDVPKAPQQALMLAYALMRMGLLKNSDGARNVISFEQARMNADLERGEVAIADSAFVNARNLLKGLTDKINRDTLRFVPPYEMPPLLPELPEPAPRHDKGITVKNALLWEPAAPATGAAAANPLAHRGLTLSITFRVPPDIRPHQALKKILTYMNDGKHGEPLQAYEDAHSVGRGTCTVHLPVDQDPERILSMAHMLSINARLAPGRSADIQTGRKMVPLNDALEREKLTVDDVSVEAQKAGVTSHDVLATFEYEVNRYVLPRRTHQVRIG